MVHIDSHVQLVYLFARNESSRVAFSVYTQPVIPVLKILFTSTNISSFISEDLRIIGKHFDVRQILTTRRNALWAIPGLVMRADVTFTWFASMYAVYVFFLAKIFGKKSVIVIGGSDVARYPELNYGIWISPWRARLLRLTLRHVWKVVSVDPFLSTQAKRLAGYDGHNIEYVPTGYDASVWVPCGDKKSLVLNVSACDTETRVKVKGLDILVKCARALPEIPFVIVGVTAQAFEILNHNAPPNLKLISYLDRSELLGYYQQAKVYCQPSLVEGLPNSLCEAMLCECVPIGSNTGGIPTAIRDNGFLVSYGNAEELTSGIRQALQAPASVGAAARRYIAETFPLERREESLVRILKGLEC